MDDAQKDADNRAKLENDGGDGLDRKARSAFVGGLGVADHVKNTPDNPDDAERCRNRIADINRKQPERRQEDRHPLQRIHLHAIDALEVRIARYGRRLDAAGFACLADRKLIRK